MKKATLILAPALLWTAVGTMLMMMGLSFLRQSHCAWLALFALPCGFAKGHFVLKKSALTQLNRLLALQELSFTKVFTKGYLFLIAVMMSLGFIFRFAPLPLRGFVDVLIGFALFVGSINYYGIYRNRHGYHRS